MKCERPKNALIAQNSHADRNFSYFIPVTPEMVGKPCELVVLAFDPENLGFTPDLWLTAYPIPFQEKTLILTE